LIDPNHPADDDMTTTVVTITKDRNEHLENLMLGLARSSVLPASLVVVDMASKRSPVDSCRDARRECERNGIEVAEVSVPVGRMTPLAAARNAGATAARGDHLIFLDVDCIPAVDLVEHYRRGHAPGLVCGPVRYLGPGWRNECPAMSDEHLTVASDQHPVRPAPVVDVTEPSYNLFWSLSFATDRQTFDAIGGFDERFVGYGAEDTDFAYTAREKQISLRWLAHGVAFHQWHPSSSPPTAHLESIVANAQRFHAKWGEWPMVGFSRGALPTIVAADVGALVPGGDVEALSLAIGQAAAIDRARCRQRAVTHFSSETMTRAYAQHYRMLIARSSESRTPSGIAGG